jgi:hypothetical protein
MKTLVCGVDEAGRGPLAGPVFAAAVLLQDPPPVQGLADSKKLTAKRREVLAGEIRDRALCWAVASASVEEIDELNILQASLLATAIWFWSAVRAASAPAAIAGLLAAKRAAPEGSGTLRVDTPVFAGMLLSVMLLLQLLNHHLVYLCYL